MNQLLYIHEVEITVTSKDLLAYADESLISHVVTNLLKNAVEAFEMLDHFEAFEYKMFHSISPESRRKEYTSNY